jgi:endonuclease/exonuclease/phosphatase family metal-dependent hydrolase
MNPPAFAAAPPVRPGYSVQPDRSVVFALDASQARSVRVAGDFTNWEAGALPMARDHDAGGLWIVQTDPLAPGAHFYQYIVDGVWKLDPAHPMMEDNGIGGTNSAFAVGGRDLGGRGALRIASLNLHCYQEPDARLKLEQIAFALRAMKVHAVALQEDAEHLTDLKQSRAGDFLAECLEKSGDVWHHEWLEAHIGFDVFREGASLLSTAPLERVRQIELSQGPLRRVALSAETTLGAGRLRLVTTHVSWPGSGGAKEVDRLAEELGPEPPDCVATLIAGDFNASPTTPQVLRLRDAGFHIVEPPSSDAGGTFGHPANDRIDYQFLRLSPGRKLAAEPRVLRVFNRNADADCYQPRVSDHMGLLGIYEVEGKG